MRINKLLEDQSHRKGGEDDSPRESSGKLSESEGGFKTPKVAHKGGVGESSVPRAGTSPRRQMSLENTSVIGGPRLTDGSAASCRPHELHREDRLRGENRADTHHDGKGKYDQKGGRKNIEEEGEACN